MIPRNGGFFSRLMQILSKWSTDKLQEKGGGTETTTLKAVG